MENLFLQLLKKEIGLPQKHIRQIHILWWAAQLHPASTLMISNWAVDWN